MKVKLLKGNHNSYLQTDTFSNDQEGLEKALNYLGQYPKMKQLTVVLIDFTVDAATFKLLKSFKVDKVILIGGKNHFEEAPVIEPYSSVEEFLAENPTFKEEMIVVKGSDNSEHHLLISHLEERHHSTVLEVNFDAVKHNLDLYKAHLTNNAKLMVMVKAIAYGAGVDEFAHYLQYYGVDYLGVAYLDEAINLRKKGIQLPIMVMNVDWNSFRFLSDNHLEPEIYSLQMLKNFLTELDNTPPIHLKIETGMNRLGFVEKDIPELLSILAATPKLKVAGIFTHFSSADVPEEDAYTINQAETLNRIYNQIINILGYKPLKHAANSAGIVRWPQYHFDMVRLGIGLYGFENTYSWENIKPISALKTVISQVKNLKEGDTVGYSRNGKVTQDSEIATVALGYADGYSRAFGNGRAHMLVNGKLAPTIGNVCMDMTMIDVTGLNAKAGDEVIVFGETPTIVDLAKWSNTIPYEILTSISPRVKREFVTG